MWVLWWQYCDFSGAAIVRVYDDENRANQDLQLVREDTSRDWFLSFVDVIKGE